MMKRLNAAVAAIALFALAGCNVYQYRKQNPYEKPLFYSKYLNSSNALDRQILDTVTALRSDPKNAPLHNRLGQLLAQKGFPKDAEVEFERAVNADQRYYPGWYNLSLMRAARGDTSGARFAMGRVLHYKPGHSQALFQMGLMAEKRGAIADAVEYYAKAFTINHSLLDVKINPQILDTNLIALALIRAYPNEHIREGLMFQGTPAGYGAHASAVAPPAPSPQAAPENIVPPSAPVTDPGRQTPVPNSPWTAPPAGTTATTGT